EKFSKVFHSSPDSITVSTVEDGVLIDINRGFEVITGLTREDVIGKSTTEINIWANKEDRGRFADLLKRDGMVRDFEHIIRNSSGEMRIALLSADIIELGGKSYMVTVGRDVTEGKKAEGQLRSSLNEKEILLKEIHHRVKNNMAVISSLLSLQAVHIGDEKITAMFDESRSRIQAMALVHEKLYQTSDFTNIDVRDYFQSLAATLRSTLSTDRVYSVSTDIDSISIDIDTLVPCGLIMNELLTNAFKHAFNAEENPEIRIIVKQTGGGNIRMTIADNGMGLPEGLDVTRSPGLGLQLVNTLIAQIDGELEVNSSDEGTEFTVKFKFRD
ncbi:PAS domain S-box protein, partial [bacterium]|nr:PAS domain S-box protein [bacterium]